MKRWLFPAVLVFAMFTASAYTARAADNTLMVRNQTAESWTVSAQILVPPKMGIEGESYGTAGYVDSKSATVGGGTSDAPATAEIPITTGGSLRSVAARSSQKRCDIDKILSLTKSFILDIKADEIILINTNGSVVGRCDI